jgi:BON domain
MAVGRGFGREAGTSVPPAPPLLSIRNCWPAFLAMAANSGRANASVPPPGGKGTTIVTGLPGQADCARSIGVQSSAALPASNRRRRKGWIVGTEADEVMLLSLKSSSFSRAAIMGLSAAVAGAGYPAGLAADDGGELRNWFDDPFFQLTDQARNCPQPAGPYVTRQERLAQSHHRAEKGTTAWLSGESDRPQAYAYDEDIAAALQQAFGANEARHRALLAGSSLWATVQGRVVYIEGCASREADAQAIEAMVRAVPYVQQAIAILRVDPLMPPPYRVMPMQPHPSRPQIPKAKPPGQ